MKSINAMAILTIVYLIASLIASPVPSPMFSLGKGKGKSSESTSDQSILLNKVHQHIADSRISLQQAANVRVMQLDQAIGRLKENTIPVPYTEVIDRGDVGYAQATSYLHHHEYDIKQHLKKGEKYIKKLRQQNHPELQSVIDHQNDLETAIKWTGEKGLAKAPHNFVKGALSMASLPKGTGDTSMHLDPEQRERLIRMLEQEHEVAAEFQAKHSPKPTLTRT